MGAPIARRLAGADFELALWNRTPEKARALGVGRVEESPEAAAAGAEVVLSIFTDAAAVRGSTSDWSRPRARSSSRCRPPVPTCWTGLALLDRRDAAQVHVRRGGLGEPIPYLQARKPFYVEGRHTPAMFFLRDMVKDVDLALDFFHTGGASTPGLALVRELDAAAVSEHGQDELSAVIERFP